MSEAKVVATDEKTITITLPAGITVTPGKAVPPELLDLLAAYFNLDKAGHLTGAEGCGSQVGCHMQQG